MELEEMKNAWLALERKMDREESMKDEQIREMLHSKVDQSTRKLMGMEISDLIGALLFSPVMVWIMETDQKFKIFAISWLIFLLIGIIWQIMKISRLIKIDQAKPLRHNIQNIEQYKIWIHKEKIFGFPVAFVTAAISFTCFVNAPLWFWVFVSSTILSGVILAFWQYKKHYDTNIKSISESLEKLNDVE